MKADCIHFKDTGYFSKIIVNYLAGEENLRPFYTYPPSIDSFSNAIENKNFSNQNRDILSSSLLNQYKKDGIKLKGFEKVEQNIDALKSNDCYTVTTGHQLCLFTGPLYFIYKIISTIKLTGTLAKKYPNKQFVPIYWMATEDHDFAEINHFNFKEKRYEWNTEQGGAVGRMSTEGLTEVFESFAKEVTDYSTNSEELKLLFKEAYLKHNTLAAATRYLVNKLFGSYGVVIVDGDDVELKRSFSSVVEKELLTEFSSRKVEEQSLELEKLYKIQVNPREINLFYLTDGARNRIVKENNAYFVVDTPIRFSEQDILKELKEHPERFSPNVLLRPVYQETILPNLAYIGGGGELAYWFQLQSTFDEVSVPMPMLILRNSVMWMNDKQSKAFKKLDISLQQMFLEEGVLLKDWVKQNTKTDLTLELEKKQNEAFFSELLEKAQKIDASLKNHVAAVKTKQDKALQQLSEKLIRAERRKQSEVADKIHFLKETLFKNRGLQERRTNFSEIYMREGKKMIDCLLNEFEVPSNNFLVVN